MKSMATICRCWQHWPSRPRRQDAVVIGRTDPCRDMDLLRRRAPKLHYVRFSSEQERQEYEHALIKMSEVEKEPKRMGKPLIARTRITWCGGLKSATRSSHTVSRLDIVLRSRRFPQSVSGTFLFNGDGRAKHDEFCGWSREGYYPYVHTFAVFICRRPFDQVAMSIAYPNLPVRMVFLPGITTPGGATHQAIDDIALMRIIPNLTILECGDATEVESVLDVAQAVNGPVYVRMLRGEVPRLFDCGEPMQLGRARALARAGISLFCRAGSSNT